METLTIELTSANALNELKELEKLHLIKFTNDTQVLPSERFKNSISKELAKEMNDEISNSRLEWNGI